MFRLPWLLQNFFLLFNSREQAGADLVFCSFHAEKPLDGFPPVGVQGENGALRQASQTEAFFKKPSPGVYMCRLRLSRGRWPLENPAQRLLSVMM